MTKPMTALISVADKTGLEDFVLNLRGVCPVDIYASEGTAKYLNDKRIQAIDVATLVGPPILGKKVITISREIHAGLLADNTPEERGELRRINVPFIDLVYVNLYPLEKELSNPEKSAYSLRKNTDIGGPTILRSAAKGRRIVLHSPLQLEEAIERIAHNRATPEYRLLLALEAEKYISKFCAFSAEALKWELSEKCKEDEKIPLN